MRMTKNPNDDNQSEISDGEDLGIIYFGPRLVVKNFKIILDSKID